MFSPQSISASVRAGAGAPDSDPPGAREFPGCRPIRITRDAIADFHGRIEYWDGDTETAWKVSEPTTVYHEGPGQRLAQLAARIAAGRGAPITTLGAADLLVRNDRGERRRILQADQIVYLHPAHTEPRGAAVEVGTDHLPDVILEVDHSTDVRRGKLAIYEAWGFPEVWVEVPDAPSPSRPKGRRSGLTIHRAQAGRFHPVTASVAFPGWTATEIHAALNEARLSAETSAVLTRVGRALGDAEGTVPDDDPWLRGQRREAATAAATQAARQAAQDAVVQILRARGLDVPARIDAFPADASQGDLVAAALACRDYADFLARSRRR